MKPRTAARLAWSLWGLTTLCLVLSLLLWSVNDPSYLVFQLILAPPFLAFPTMGALIASRRPSNPIGWIFCSVGLTYVAIFAQQYAWYALITKPGSLPGGIWAAWLALAFVWCYNITFTFPMLLFPDGKLPSPRWRPVAWVVAFFLVGQTVTLLFAPGPIPMQGRETVFTPANNPLGLAFVGQVAPALSFVGSILQLPVLLACVLALVVRFRRARGDERQQLKWVAYAGVALIVIGTTTNFLPNQPDIVALAGVAIASLSIIAYPVAVGIAILKYRLYDIDVIIRRTLVYAVLTGMLALVYWGGVALLQEVLRPITGGGNDLAIVATTLVIAALFFPLRRAIQGFIDRRFYRRKYDAARTLAAFGQVARDEVDLETLKGKLLSVVDETIRPTHVSLWLHEPKRKG